MSRHWGKGRWLQVKRLGPRGGSGLKGAGLRRLRPFTAAGLTPAAQHRRAVASAAEQSRRRGHCGGCGLCSGAWSVCKGGVACVGVWFPLPRSAAGRMCLWQLHQSQQTMNDWSESRGSTTAGYSKHSKLYLKDPVTWFSLVTQHK